MFLFTFEILTSMAHYTTKFHFHLILYKSNINVLSGACLFLVVYCRLIITLRTAMVFLCTRGKSTGIASEIHGKQTSCPHFVTAGKTTKISFFSAFRNEFALL